jgi:hypothetical protein
MKTTLLLVASVLVGCAPRPVATGSFHRFYVSDENYDVAPRSELARVLVDEKEVADEPLFKVVGVLEIEGKETERLSTFLARAEEQGANVGCDVLIHRDAFELGTRVQRGVVPQFNNGVALGSLGRDWLRSDQVVWQFLCGVEGEGATAEEQILSMREAAKLAVDLRVRELGNYEPCQPFVPTGSHILKTRVCADDPGHHTQADGRSSAPSR